MAQTPTPSRPWRFTFRGKIKPYVRMTRRGKFVNDAAQEYLASQEALAWQIRQQMTANGWQTLPKRTPLAVSLSIATVKKNTSDIDNIFKAVADSGNDLLWPDDRWIDEISVKRRKAKAHEASLAVWIL